MNLENHGAQMTLSSRRSWGPITSGCRERDSAASAIHVDKGADARIHQ
jgi:hypothetical protein